MEYAPLAGTSRTSALALFKILGWIVSVDKLKPSHESFSALGVVFDCAATPHDLLGIRNKDGRIDEISLLIRKASSQRSMSTPQMQKLRGKLAFASQQTSGRWPSLLLPLLSLKDSDDETGGNLLEWFEKNLGPVPRRVLNFAPRGKPWLVFSDSAVAWKDAGVEHPICEVEMLAVLSVYSTWGPLTRGSRCIAFIDNTSCLDALIRNKTSSDPMRPLLCEFATLEFEYQITWWLTRVPSHSNAADYPSRLKEPCVPSGWSAFEWRYGGHRALTDMCKRASPRDHLLKR